MYIALGKSSPEALRREALRWFRGRLAADDWMDSVRAEANADPSAGTQAVAPVRVPRRTVPRPHLRSVA